MILWRVVGPTWLGQTNPRHSTTGVDFSIFDNVVRLLSRYLSSSSNCTRHIHGGRYISTTSAAPPLILFFVRRAGIRHLFNDNQRHRVELFIIVCCIHFPILAVVVFFLCLYPLLIKPPPCVTPFCELHPILLKSVVFFIIVGYIGVNVVYVKICADARTYLWVWV